VTATGTLPPVQEQGRDAEREQGGVVAGRCRGQVTTITAEGDLLPAAPARRGRMIMMGAGQ
jgi:hypothetical protein